MDKIKNVINPGSKRDDEVMYGSGQSGDPVHEGGQSGQGRHVGNARTTGGFGGDSDPTPSTPAHADPAFKPSKAEEILGGQDPYAGASTIQDPAPMSDSATTASIKSGIPGETQTGKGLGEDTYRAKSGVSSSTGNTTAGPHSSDIGNKADPRVDSDLDGRGGLKGTPATTDTKGYTTGVDNSTALPDRSVQGAGYEDTVSQPGTSHFDRDAALGAGALGVGGAAAHHSHGRGHQQATNPDTGRPFSQTGDTITSTGVDAAGPHSSNLANKADPRVDSDLDGSRIAGTGGATAVGSSAPTISNETTSPRGYGQEAWEKDGHSHEFQGDPCHGQEKPVEGVVHHTKGPHSTDIANALDPHVGATSTSKSASHSHPTGGAIGSESTTSGVDSSTAGKGFDSTTIDTGRGVGSASGTDGSVAGRGLAPSHDLQHGSTKERDPTHSAAAATAGGIGGAGLAANGQRGEANSHDETLTGPVHKSGLLNKLDPRVKSVSETSHDSGVSEPKPSTTSDKDHRHGREAGLAGAGAVAAGTAYEAGRKQEGYSSEQYPHSGTSLPPSTATGTTGLTDSSSGVSKHETGLKGDHGVASYEAEKHLGRHHKSGLGGNPSQAAKGESSSVGPISTTTEPSRDHNRGNLSAAGAGAGVGVAALEAERLRQPHQTNPTDPSITAGSQQPHDYEGNRGSARDKTEATHKPFVQHDDTKPPSKGEHTGLAAVGAGAGAGAGAAAGMSEKEAKKLEKEHIKEEKAHEKEIEKEQKHHQKELEKEQKHHQKEVEKEHKALAKEEKKHHHDVEKEEKKHHHGVEKEEKKHHDDEDKTEKKHGGILGLFKRDKTDDELKREEVGRKYAEDDHTNVPSMAEVGMSEKEKHALAKEHDHQRNRLHKDPPAGYYEQVAQNDPSQAPAPHGDTPYAEAPSKGYASQVTGGTGTTALAQGSEIPAGSHLSKTGNQMDPSVASRGENVDQSAIGGTSTTGTSQIPTGKYDARDTTTNPAPRGL